MRDFVIGVLIGLAILQFFYDNKQDTKIKELEKQVIELREQVSFLMKD